MVIVFQSASPSSSVLSAALLALTLGKPATEVGRALVGRVTVMVTSEAEGEAVLRGAGEESEEGRRVVAEAAAAFRLGRTAGMDTAGADGTAAEGRAAGGRLLGTSGTSEVGRSVERGLSGAETEGTAGAAAGAEGTAAAATGGELKSLGTGAATGTSAVAAVAAVVPVATGAAALATASVAAAAAPVTSGTDALTAPVSLNGVGTPNPN